MPRLTPDPKGDKIDMLRQLMAAGALTFNDMKDFMDPGGMSFSVPPSLLKQRMDQRMDELKETVFERSLVAVFGEEGANVARQTLDLGFKGKPPVHQPLWDKISKECGALIERMLEKGLELVEHDPSAYTTSVGQTTRPIIYLGSYVMRVFKDDMQRAYGGQQGEIRLGGCRVTNDPSIAPERVFIVCYGMASVTAVLAGDKHDWAWTSFLYDQHALAAGNSEPEEAEEAK